MFLKDLEKSATSQKLVNKSQQIIQIINRKYAVNVNKVCTNQVTYFAPSKHSWKEKNSKETNNYVHFSRQAAAVNTFNAALLQGIH
jgi:hypothetical protein